MNIYTMMKDRAGLGAGGEDAVGSPAVEGCFGGCAWSMRGNWYYGLGLCLGARMVIPIIYI